MPLYNKTSLKTIVCAVFELGDVTVALSSMENKFVECNL